MDDKIHIIFAGCSFSDYGRLYVSDFDIDSLDKNNSNYLEIYLKKKCY
jgi:hypothetical protein